MLAAATSEASLFERLDAIKFRDLRIAHDLIKTLRRNPGASLQEAAHHMGRAPQQVSQRLGRLEIALGAELVERSEENRRSGVPTPTGLRFERAFDPMLKGWGDFLADQEVSSRFQQDPPPAPTSRKRSGRARRWSG